MSTRNVYHVHWHHPDWEAADAGIFGTVTRARAHVKREGYTRRYRQADHGATEVWITPDEQPDELGNVEHHASIYTRRIR